MTTFVIVRNIWRLLGTSNINFIVKLKTSYFGLPLIHENDRIVPVYVWQFHVSITIIYRSIPSIKIVFYLLTAVNLYNIHIQINKYTMSAIEIIRIYKYKHSLGYVFPISGNSGWPWTLEGKENTVICIFIILSC